MCVWGGVCWHLGIGARDAANHPTVHRTEKELSDPKVKSAEAAQLSPLVTRRPAAASKTPPLRISGLYNLKCKNYSLKFTTC